MIQTQHWLFGERILIVDEQHRGSVILEIPNDKKNICHLDGWIYSLWVDKPFRCKGIAKSLLATAELVAKEKGCEDVGLEWDGREAEPWTYDWYLRAGYQLHVSHNPKYVLWKEL